MNQADHNLALNLWELTNDFGTAPVGPLEWTKRYSKTRRSWDRLVATVRQSPYPATYPPAEGLPDARGRANPTMRALGLQFPRGAKAEFTKILDNASTK